VTRYRAPWARGLRGTTWAVVVLLAFVAAAVVAFAAGTGGPAAAAWTAAIVFPALAGTLLLVRALAPRGFIVDAEAVRVQRTLGDVIIPFSRLRAVARFPGPLATPALLLGSAGVFGYHGSFWSRSLGAFFLYATRRTDLVLLDTDGERFLLSPEPAGQFVEEVLSRSPGARREAGAAPAARGGSPA
jgi:hypothetical protein